MKETLLNHLFKLITDLRIVEMRLVGEEQLKIAEKVKEANKDLSDFRDKLITAQLKETSEKLKNATEHLQRSSEDLQAYLDSREEAKGRLESILRNLPALTALLNGLTTG